MAQMRISVKGSVLCIWQGSTISFFFSGHQDNNLIGFDTNILSHKNVFNNISGTKWKWVYYNKHSMLLFCSYICKLWRYVIVCSSFNWSSFEKSHCWTLYVTESSFATVIIPTKPQTSLTFSPLSPAFSNDIWGWLVSY